MELRQVATSYISTNGTRATWVADGILSDLSMSMFKLYGVRNFVGSVGRRGLLGADGPVSAKGDARDQGIQGLKGDT